MHEVLVNRLGGLSLSRKSVVRLTDRPDMTLDVYRGRKTTMQQQQQQPKVCVYMRAEMVGLVGCFGLNGPLRQYFSLYRAVSQRGEKEKRKDRREKKCPNNPTRTYCKRSRPLPYSNPNK